MVALPGSEALPDRENLAGQPRFRYPSVLLLMLAAVVFLVTVIGLLIGNFASRRRPL